ncbi:hypothetical protein FF38_03080 [Lucilia cuprina]|uniref:Uncharacterized protein n=1 Tax=Lucilia cuprina TaxID=7375 RepID=A0A0L0CJW6_LUCCU|nr:hypothetical protein FF38_05459 [Lucilia cuprina]KNC32540.1 hypothetical protein FF38_03080 [Lucilia cuprina]
MSKLRLFVVILLATLQYCYSLPYRAQTLTEDVDSAEDETFCGHQQHKEEFNGQQQYPLYNNHVHYILYNRLLQIPQDQYHRPEYVNTNMDKSGHSQNDIYADANDDDDELEFQQRTIQDVPKNCKKCK